MADDDPNPRASSYVPRGPNRDLRSAMRASLREVGIEYDDVDSPRRTTDPRTIAPPPDRDAIRAVLSELGATEAQLAWLVPSCPSLELARAWRPAGWIEPLPVAPAPAPDPEPQPTPAPQRGWPKITR